MVELIVKLYNDKPSRLGIRFIYEYQAVKEYEQVLTRHPDTSYTATIEFVRQKINLQLTGDHSGAKVMYKDLGYKIEQLKKLLVWQDQKMPLLFVHVFPKSNAMFVAKPFRKEHFLTISDLQIIVSGAPSGF